MMNVEQVYHVQVSAVWHNMREEPVIYINGRPFVLREDERPFKNMQEYTGIDVRRLEQMELRLKNDILQVCICPCACQADQFALPCLYVQATACNWSNSCVLLPDSTALVVVEHSRLVHVS